MLGDTFVPEPNHTLCKGTYKELRIVNHTGMRDCTTHTIWLHGKLDTNWYNCINFQIFLGGGCQVPPPSNHAYSSAYCTGITANHLHMWSALLQYLSMKLECDTWTSCLPYILSFEPPVVLKTGGKEMRERGIHLGLVMTCARYMYGVEYIFCTCTFIFMYLHVQWILVDVFVRRDDCCGSWLMAVVIECLFDVCICWQAKLVKNGQLCALKIIKIEPGELIWMCSHTV